MRVQKWKIPKKETLMSSNSKSELAELVIMHMKNRKNAELWYKNAWAINDFLVSNWGKDVDLKKLISTPFNKIDIEEFGNVDCAMMWKALCESYEKELDEEIEWI